MKKLFCCLCLCLSQVSFGQSTLELLQMKLKAMNSLTASFTQVVKAKHQELSQSSGTMAIQRPGRFRWQINSPMEQLLIADGKKLWIYDKDLEQVTVKKQTKAMEGTAALFLTGSVDKLTEEFVLSQNGQASKLVFEMKAKSARANFQRLQLFFNQDELKKLVLQDQLGQTTTVRFTEIQANPHLSLALFQFKTPKGVDVVQQ